MNKRIRWTAVWMVLLITVMLMAGLSASAEEYKYTFGYSIPRANPYWMQAYEGAQKRAQSLGIKLIMMDCREDIMKQISDVEDLIRQKVDGILISATDTAGITPAVLAANEAGIPVASVDMGVGGGEVATWVVTDNRVGGKMVADFILEKLTPVFEERGGATVVVLDYQGYVLPIYERIHGCIDVLKQRNDVQIILQPVRSMEREDGLRVMENILQAHKNVDAVYAYNDEVLIGAVQALEDFGSEAISVGFDAMPSAIAAIKSGRVDATVAQFPRAMGALAVQALYDDLQGKELTSKTVLDPVLVIQENVESYAEPFKDY
jgi:ribose transport system substrate-binding protein